MEDNDIFDSVTNHNHNHNHWIYLIYNYNMPVLQNTGDLHLNRIIECTGVFKWEVQMWPNALHLYKYRCQKQTLMPWHCVSMPWPGFEPGLLRPQRRVLTTIRSRRATRDMSCNGSLSASVQVETLLSWHSRYQDGLVRTNTSADQTRWVKYG